MRKACYTGVKMIQLLLLGFLSSMAIADAAASGTYPIVPSTSPPAYPSMTPPPNPYLPSPSPSPSPSPATMPTVPPPSPPPLPSSTNASSPPVVYPVPPSLSPASSPPVVPSNSPVVPPYSMPPSYFQPASIQPPPAPPVPDTKVPLSGYALFVGPAASCTGIAGAGSTTANVTTNAWGELSGDGAIGEAQEGLLVILQPWNSTCKDAFTGLPLPFEIGAPWTTPDSGTAQVTLTPATRLLAYTDFTDAVNATGVIPAAYRIFGVDASGAETGALAALKKPTAYERLTGVRMLAVDTALTSLVVTAAPAVAAATLATADCSNFDEQIDAIFHALAEEATTGVNLTNPSLCPAIIQKAVARCNGSNTTGEAAALKACPVYTAAITTVQVDSEDQGIMPLLAVGMMARVSYVVQTAGVTAVTAAIAGNVTAVDNLLADWNGYQVRAPINLTAISAALGLGDAPSADSTSIFARGFGSLTDCPVIYNQLVNLAKTLNFTTNAKGVVTFINVTSGLVSVSSGCRDAALSVGGKVVRSPFSMSALVPQPLIGGSVFVNPAAYLATGAFLVRQAHEAPRGITAADYAAVYNYFGIGLSGAADVLPQGADFVRQNWPDKNALVVRSYVLNQRLLGAVGPSSSFMSGLLKHQVSTDDVAQSFFEAMSYDMVNKTLKPDDKEYLMGLMRGFYQRQFQQSSSSSRRLLQALDLTQLNQLLTSVATAVAEVSSKFVELDRQAVTAAAAGQTIDVGSLLLSAAKVTSVAQESLTNMLTELAVAASSGNTTALTALTSQLSSSFSAAGLEAQVQSATVDASGIGAVGNNAEPTVEAGGTAPPVLPAAIPPSKEKKTKNVDAIVGGVVGGVVGAAMIAVIIAAVVIRHRRSKQQVHGRSRNDGRINVLVPDPETGAANTNWLSGSTAPPPPAMAGGAAAGTADGVPASPDNKLPGATNRSLGGTGNAMATAENVEFDEESDRTTRTMVIPWASPRSATVSPRERLTSASGSTTTTAAAAAAGAGATSRDGRDSHFRENHVHPDRTSVQSAAKVSPVTTSPRDPSSSSLDDNGRWWAPA
ncbi:hypothetical protein Vretimale_11220 [Volvox reticuliferus]|uniref:Uncharacterized protein n=1 Tax=Volvox reticuliferus TaxID=1737510 RepID=A0A8J4CHV6_9CHLO|nr:hypothetical protein Vretifemale_12241 [Volvox reticuliferus]GIM07016.1 hypothetical protein Vretimale_11220 [Volvox reticuliferus]